MISSFEYFNNFLLSFHRIFGISKFFFVLKLYIHHIIQYIVAKVTKHCFAIFDGSVSGAVWRSNVKQRHGIGLCNGARAGDGAHWPGVEEDEILPRGRHAAGGGLFSQEPAARCGSDAAGGRIGVRIEMDPAGGFEGEFV